MRNHPLNPFHQAKRAPVMGGRPAAQDASRSLYGATMALRAAETPLMKAPATPRKAARVKHLKCAETTIAFNISVVRCYDITTD